MDHPDSRRVSILAVLFVICLALTMWSLHQLLDGPPSAPPPPPAVELALVLP